MRSIQVNVQGRWYTVEVGDSRRSQVEVMVEGERYLVEIGGASPGPITAPGGHSSATEAREPTGLRGITQRGEKIIRCPMPGRIVVVSLSVEQRAQAGDEICVLETMKMEQSILLPQDGNVREVFIRPGENVQGGDPLIEME